MSIIHTSAEDALQDKYAARDRKNQVAQEVVKAAAVAAAIEASAAAAVIREAARSIKAAADQKERERDQQQRQWSGPVDSPPREPAGTAKERAVKALMAQQREAQPVQKVVAPAPKRPAARGHQAAAGAYHQQMDEAPYVYGNTMGSQALGMSGSATGGSVARPTTAFAGPVGQYGLNALLSVRPQQQPPPQAYVIPQHQQQHQQQRQSDAPASLSAQLTGVKRPAAVVAPSRRDDDDDEDDDYFSNRG